MRSSGSSRTGGQFLNDVTIIGEKTKLYPSFLEPVVVLGVIMKKLSFFIVTKAAHN
jgi:hypothetical protein